MKGHGLYLFFVIFCFVSCHTSEKTFTKIDEALMEQQSAWNQGNLHAFMDGYEASEDLSFMGSGGVSKGWNKVLNNYIKGYPDKEAMGRLEFTILERQRLNRRNVLYLGKYELFKEEYAFGYFTLLWERKKDGWKIIHDHTSAAKP